VFSQPIENFVRICSDYVMNGRESG
jgi:hypothetical protein